jgi:hypothetical protein
VAARMSSVAGEKAATGDAAVSCSLTRDICATTIPSPRNAGGIPPWYKNLRLITGPSGCRNRNSREIYMDNVVVGLGGVHTWLGILSGLKERQSIISPPLAAVPLERSCVTFTRSLSGPLSNASPSPFSTMVLFTELLHAVTDTLVNG